MEHNQLGWSVSSFVKDALGGAISRARLYELWEQGEGPKQTRIGRRILILRRDAEEWLESLKKENVK